MITKARDWANKLHFVQDDTALQEIAKIIEAAQNEVVDHMAALTQQEAYKKPRQGDIVELVINIGHCGKRGDKRIVVEAGNTGYAVCSLKYDNFYAWLGSAQCKYVGRATDEQYEKALVAMNEGDEESDK